MNTKENASPLTYEQALNRLEELTTQMENGQLPVDQLAASLREAQELLAHCRSLLYQADEAVEKILHPEEEK